MLTLMCENENDMMVSRYEFQEKPVYTYETLDHFKRKYPEDDIYFICGTDNLSYMDQWKKGDYILANYKLLIIKRKTDDIGSLLEKYKKYRNNIVITNIREQKLSSTTIRENIKNQKSIKRYVDKKVYQYMMRNHLYDQKKDQGYYYVIKSY